jgi:non-canonical poly(A) RNA polymerase PAPD5/7
MSDLSVNHISFESSENEVEVPEVMSEEEIAPWMSKTTRGIQNPNIRFHTEIVEFYEFMKPQKDEYNIRLAAFHKIKNLIESSISKCSLIPFGSFTTKLYLPSSDVDLVLMSKTHDKQFLLTKATKVVMQNPDIFSQVEILKNARIPVIKFIDADSKIQFDIIFNEKGGLTNIDEVKQALKVHPEMKYLVFLFKLMLRQRRMNNSFTGGVGSFLLFCMILTFLREFKKRKVYEQGLHSLEYISLAEYVLKFMQFYGVEFDFHRREILMTNGGRIVEKDRPAPNLGLISPMNPEHNIGNQAFKLRDVFSVFKNRFNFMTNYSFEPNQSILKHLVNPSNRDFSIYTS